MNTNRLGLVLVAASLASADQQHARPPAQSEGVLVELPPTRPVAEMTEEEILAGELGGEVTAVSGSDLTIAVRGSPCVPRVGDRVELFRVRKGFAFAAGEWRVSYAEGDDIRAAAILVKAQPTQGMTAIIHSAIPAGTLSHIGFENTARRQLPVADMAGWASRHLELVDRAKRAFLEGNRYLRASPPDYQRAADAFRESARLNHVPAATALFQLYGRGGAAPDVLEAAKWLRRAAELGDIRAQHTLGAAYENNADVGPAAPAKALAWYRNAAAHGSEDSRIRLRRLAR